MISERLKNVILTELQLKEFPLEDSTVADRVPGWDSLSHARIITAVEAEYRIHFKTVEVIRLKNVGDLQALVNQKTTQADAI
jgi:acyl carrier protein